MPATDAPSRAGTDCGSAAQVPLGLLNRTRAWAREGVDARRLRGSRAAVARAARQRTADVGEGDRRAHAPAAAVPRADPARGEGRRARALEARRRRRLRARPPARARSRSPTSSPRSRARSSRSGSTPTTARATASCRRCGSCVSDETRRYLEQVTLADLVERTRVGHPDAVDALTPARRAVQRPRASVEHRRQLGRQRLRRTASRRRRVAGWSNASSRRVQERAVERDRVALAAVGARRRRPDGRSRRDARGSDGCDRSRAGSRAGCTAARRYASRTSYPVRAGWPASRTAMRVRRALGAADRRVDHAARRRRACPTRARRSGARPCASASCATSASYARARARDDQQPARVAVEAVHDAGPARVADASRSRGSARAARCTSVPVGVPGARVHDEPGRLGDDDTSSSS